MVIRWLADFRPFFVRLNMDIKTHEPVALNERLAYINGYLDSISILNTTANNAMEHWLIDLGPIDQDLNNTIKKGTKAPNWTFNATEIPDWKNVMEDECFYFFSNILYEIQGSEAYYRNNERRYDLTEKYNLEAQLSYFIRIVDELLQFCQLKTAYRIEVDSRISDENDPYFAHGECNYAFQTDSNNLLYLHLGASD